MKFSERIGVEESESRLQIDSADENLRIGIWNLFYRFLIDDPWAKPLPTIHEEYLTDIWEYFFKQSLDDEPQIEASIQSMKEWISNAEWYLLYDFLEFMVTIVPPAVVHSFSSAANKTLERERSAYRLLDSKIVPVTDAAELEAVREAMASSERWGVDAARDALAMALAELSERDGGDYDLAILEAVRAVRAIARMITGNDRTSAAHALGKLDEDGLLPKPFLKSVEEIFKVGESTGNRHIFRSGNGVVRIDEARLMVVWCSALINYLLTCARRSGLEPVKRSDLKPGEIEGPRMRRLPPAASSPEEE